MSVAAPVRPDAASTAAPVALDDPGAALVDAIEARLRGIAALADAADAARAMLGVAEDVLARWVEARGDTPTASTREGFRLLALHRQGAQDLPSFNACRETCREIAYHYNLLCPADGGDAPAAGDAVRVRAMMDLLVRHLALFVGGKMHSERVGDFCCAARPLRQED